MTSGTTNGAKKSVQVRIYRRRNRLKDKIGGLGTPGETGGFSVEALARAEAEFAKMAEDYPDWVGGYITALFNELEQARPRAADMRSPNFSRMNQLAHEMKGQGGTFGYPLISVFGKSLYEFTSVSAGTSDSQLDIVTAHIDAMQAVIKGRVNGDGGALGAELVRTLDEAIQKQRSTAS